MIIIENDDNSGWTRIECSFPTCKNELQFPGTKEQARAVLLSRNWAIVITTRMSEEAHCPGCQKEARILAAMDNAQGI